MGINIPTSKPISGNLSSPTTGQVNQVYLKYKDYDSIKYLIV